MIKTEKKLNLFFYKAFLSLSISLITILLLCVYAKAEPAPVQKWNSNRELLLEKIQQAMDAFYRMNFEQSEEIFDEIVQTWPDDPLAYLINGGFYLEQFRFHYKDNTKNENTEIKENIFNLNGKVIELAGKQIEKNKNDEESYFFLGAANGNNGRFYMINSQFLKGFWLGKKGFKLCEKVIEMNPDFCDAYLGVGLFHYLTATLPKVIKVLSFLIGAPEGNKDQGIRELEFVRDNSKVLNVEARRILLRAARWEKDWEMFYTGSKWLAERYPENIYFQTDYINGLAHNNQLEEAQNQMKKVNSLLENDPNKLPVSVRVQYFVYLGFLNFQLGEYSKSVRFYSDAITLAQEKKPFERIYDEDYYYLATSYASLSQKEEAFIYLEMAIKNGWEKAGIVNQPEWKPYLNDKEFVEISTIDMK